MQYGGMPLHSVREMKSLIIGAGQIGSALNEIFSDTFDCHMRDIAPLKLEGVEVLHIAYPYSDKFVGDTKAYIEQYKPRLTMIHSTVAIGTTEECGDHVVHTPERGRFPNLAKEMISYKKFIGGFDMDDCALAAQYLRACKWDSQIVDDPKITEALKLISNAHMGLEIAWRQELEHWLVDREVYQLWEDSYFSGYVRFGQMNLIRPRMRPDPIGGHCIVPSVEILKKSMKIPFLDQILETNERTKREKETQAARS